MKFKEKWEKFWINRLKDILLLDNLKKELEQQRFNEMMREYEKVKK